MLDLLSDPNACAALLTLTALEIVLGIDNIIFLSIVTARLPEAQQPLARRLGLGLALGGRLVLLFCLSWLIGLTAPVFTVLDLGISWRDIILIVGGVFLIAKGTMEMHHMVEGEKDHDGERPKASFAGVIVQIFLLDLVFSLDSVLTAIGMSNDIEIMVAAVVIAMIVMLIAAEPTSRFVQNHPTVKMLALAFLLLVGVTLIADGLHHHVPRSYLYFAIAFSAGVEAMNLWVAARRKKRRAATSA